MKKALLLSAFIALLFSCEKKDPVYPFTITVRTLADSISVPNTHVEILASANSGTFELFFEGYTDQYGKVSFEYGNNAIFTARATRGVTPITYIGCADVRLEADKEVFKTVYIRPYDPEAEGCDYSR